MRTGVDHGPDVESRRKRASRTSRLVFSKPVSHRQGRTMGDITRRAALICAARQRGRSPAAAVAPDAPSQAPGRENLRCRQSQGQGLASPARLASGAGPRHAVAVRAHCRRSRYLDRGQSNALPGCRAPGISNSSSFEDRKVQQRCHLGRGKACHSGDPFMQACAGKWHRVSAAGAYPAPAQGGIEGADGGTGMKYQ